MTHVSGIPSEARRGKPVAPVIWTVVLIIGLTAGGWATWSAHTRLDAFASTVRSAQNSVNRASDTLSADKASAQGAEDELTQQLQREGLPEDPAQTADIQGWVSTVAQDRTDVDAALAVKNASDVVLANIQQQFMWTLVISAVVVFVLAIVWGLVLTFYRRRIL